MSLQRFGTTKETVGRVVKSDGQEAYVLSWAASAVAVQSASGLGLVAAAAGSMDRVRLTAPSAPAAIVTPMTAATTVMGPSRRPIRIGGGAGLRSASDGGLTTLTDSAFLEHPLCGKKMASLSMSI